MYVEFLMHTMFRTQTFIMKMRKEFVPMLRYLN